MNIRPYKSIQWYRIITYILTLAKHAYYDRFELVKQRNDLDMDVIIFNIFIFTTKKFWEGRQEIDKVFSSNFQSKSGGPHPSEKTQKWIFARERGKANSNPFWREP